MKFWKHIISKHRISILLLLFYIVSISLRSEDKLENIYQYLMNSYNVIDTYQADFIQYNHWEEHDITADSEGRIFITKNKYALDYYNPEGQKVIIDSLVYIIDEIEKTIIITMTDENINPIDIISTFWDKSSKDIKSKEAESIKIRLVPEDDPDIKNILITIKRPDYLITKIEYKDFENNRVKFTFLNETINEPIDKSVFIIPKKRDYSVFDQRSY